MRIKETIFSYYYTILSRGNAFTLWFQDFAEYQKGTWTFDTAEYWPKESPTLYVIHRTPVENPRLLTSQWNKIKYPCQCGSRISRTRIFQQEAGLTYFLVSQKSAWITVEKNNCQTSHFCNLESFLQISIFTNQIENPFNLDLLLTDYCDF